MKGKYAPLFHSFLFAAQHVLEPWMIITRTLGFLSILFGVKKYLQLGNFLPLLILGPLSEEIGWRGYALERLQTRWNALTSSLMVGLGIVASTVVYDGGHFSA
jgi:membrane protease YdiL (CAAX protease family)